MKYCINCGYELVDEAKFCLSCGTPVPDTKASENKKENTPLSEETKNTKDENRKTVIHETVSYGKSDLNNLPEGYIIEERYEIKRKLGQGGFGAVYLAYDKKMVMDKALKVIPESVAEDIRAMKTLEREARTMIRLNHPNIVRFYDFHDKGRIKFIDMEYIEGNSISKKIAKSKGDKLEEREVKAYTVQILEGLGYAHKNRVIHRDIKPQNIMITSEGEVKIMDFGIAETLRNSISRLEQTTSSGTLVYMSPEQIRGKDLGKESDIYSLGATMYEMLSGNPPFYRGDVNYQILNEKPEKIEGVSENINKILQKALSKDYTERYRSCEEMLIALSGKEVIETTKTEVADRIEQKQYTRSSSSIKAVTYVSINTNPKGATIFIDGKKLRELTPLKEELKIGTHNIKIEKEGYKVIQSVLEIKENISNKFIIDLESCKGSITIETKEIGLPIFLNGKKTQFKTPHTFTDIIPGKRYKFYINDDSFYSNEEEVIIGENQNRTIKIRTIKYASIVIITSYKKAQFKLDKTEIAANTKYNWQAGKYLLETTLDFLPEIEIEMKEGENKVIDIDEYIPMGTIIIKSEKYETQAVFKNYETGKEINLEPNKKNATLPGVGKIICKHKSITREYIVTSADKEVTIDFAKVIKERKSLRKKMMIALALLIAIIAIIVTIVQREHEITLFKLNKELQSSMVFVQGGTFRMGNNNGDSDEKPVHTVTVDDFYIEKYEVTQKEWKAVMGNNPSDFKGDNLPVESVSWYEAISFCNKLSEKAGLTKFYTIDGTNIKMNWGANGYRLPTEAEWEYAARGGNQSNGYKYSGSDNIDDVAWYGDNSSYWTHEVGTKQPNELGIYDMSGNVWEWCNDWFADDYYINSPTINPRGPSDGSFRIYRGGAWRSDASFCRVTIRNGNDPSGSYSGLGFRLSRSPVK